MKVLNIVGEYKELDRKLASFSNRLYSINEYEVDVFTPTLESKVQLEEELIRLRQEVEKLHTGDVVYELLKRHFLDFIDEQEALVKKMYMRPSLHMSNFIRLLSDMTRIDSREDKEKVEIIIKKYAQAPKVWNAISSWIKNVEIEALTEVRDDFKIFCKAMSIHISKLRKYFPNLEQKENLEQAIKTLDTYMRMWEIDVVELINEKEKMYRADKTNFIMQKDDYKEILQKEHGVQFDDVYTWYNTEFNKTRQAVFNIAKNIKMPTEEIENMQDVYNLFAKYAGPCDSAEEMMKRGIEYIARARKVAKGYVQFPDDEVCIVSTTPEHLKESFPWGGYNGGCKLGRPIKGETFFNNYNFKAVTDVWIKMMAIHEVYPGHHIQFVRATLDPLPETLKLGAKSTPLMEGTAHWSEEKFSFIFSEDMFYPLFVAYRRHHTAVRVKADFMMRYEGATQEEIIEFYMKELGIDINTAKGQVKCHEIRPGYFTCYYYGVKKIIEFQEKYGFGDKEYTEYLFSVGKMGIDNFERFLALSKNDKKRFLTIFCNEN